jgi:hypothetical protein
MNSIKLNNFKPLRINAKEWDKNQVMNYVCAELANTAIGLENVLKRAPQPMPSRKTVMAWIAKDSRIGDRYEQAKQLQIQLIAEDILIIADNCAHDYLIKVNKDGQQVVVLNSDNIQRARLRIDSRKWLMSKLMPKKYGDRLYGAHTENNNFSNISAAINDLQGRNNLNLIS